MEANRAAFERFVELFYTQKRVRDAFAYLVSDHYIQHNPTIQAGPAAAIEALTPKFDGSPENRFDVLRIQVPGGSVHDHPMF
jgi:predicted SnoaL-like aldol condensation-catalyzing enzyme